MPVPGVASAGLIGSAGGLVSISDETISSLNASASLTLAGNGTITGDGNVSNFTGLWVVPPSAASNAFQVRATVSSGVTPGGTIGTWVGLGTSRMWDVGAPGAPGSDTCVLLIEIRRAADSMVLDSATYTMGATTI